MKLASLKVSHSRDGELCVVSKDLTIAIRVNHIVPTLQLALENWGKYEHELNQIYQQLNLKKLPNFFEFDPKLI